MSLKRMIKNEIKRVRYQESSSHDIDKLALAEIMLGIKMNLWDSDKLRFTPENWGEYGFKAFSQNNEDGLLQYIIHHTKIQNETFIEFGVESYNESNTRFLLLHNCWSGYILDCSKEYMKNVKKEWYYWRRNINSKVAFITKDNINRLLSESGFDKKVGLLSIDIDGNDYWILKSINEYDPTIVICEYNCIFGSKESVSIPYSDSFIRSKGHYSNLYWGASLKAFLDLLSGRGYKLVCLNNIRNNAFFVKKGLCDLPEISIDDVWKEGIYNETRGEGGELTYLPINMGRKLISSLPVIDVNTGKMKRVKDILL